MTVAYGSEVAKICKIVNGYEVEFYDPPAKKSKDEFVSSSRAWKTVAFKNTAEVLRFLKANLDRLKPENHDAAYADGFAQATAKD